MKFSNIKFEVIGDSYSRFYKEMLNLSLPCTNIVEIKDVLYFEVPVEYKKNCENLCTDLGYSYKILSEKGVSVFLKRLWNHKGLLVGGLTALAFCLISGNFVFKIDILSDNQSAERSVMAVLNENNVGTLSYIPKLNFAYLERELKQKVDEISWAGISVSGSTLTIDVVDNVPKPAERSFRLPCNLVAICDGVIDKAEVFEGELVKTVGSGVAKGDIIVSGTIVAEDEQTAEDEDEQPPENVKYVHSVGNIYGTFEKKVTVTQNYSDTRKTVSDKTKKKHYFKLFDVEVPLFVSSPKGNYIAESTYSQAHIGSLKFPFGIKTLRLNEYSYEKCVYNDSEAEEKAREQLSKYEKNFFKDYEIQSKNVKTQKTENGITLTADYILYGNIACESEFFIKK